MLYFILFLQMHVLQIMLKCAYLQWLQQLTIIPALGRLRQGIPESFPGSLGDRASSPPASENETVR